MSPLSHAELITITGGTRESNPLFERFEKTYHNVVFRMYVVLLAILCLLGTHLFVFRHCSTLLCLSPYQCIR